MHTQAPARSVFAVLILLSLTLALVGCGNQPVAVVNGTKITKAAFSERLEKTHGEQVLGDLILRALIDDAFAKSGLVLDEAEIQEEIDKAVQSAPDQNAWLQMLEARGMTEADFREFIAFHMKVRKLATKDVDASEDAVRAFFEENKEAFAQPEMTEFSLIVLSEKAEAEKLSAQLKSNPEQFNDLARQYSLEPGSRERGGRYPKTPTAQIRPTEIRDQLARLQPGGISGAFEAGGNWCLVKLDAVHAAKQPSYDEMANEAREAYLLDHAKSETELMDELRKSAHIHIVDARFHKLMEYFQPVSDSLPTFGAGGEAPPSDDQPPADAPGGAAGDAAGEPAAQPADGQ